MSSEVVSRLQERATALTQERKRRGRTVPEGLLAPDQIRSFLTLASHPVSSSVVMSVTFRHHCKYKYGKKPKDLLSFFCFVKLAVEKSALKDKSQKSYIVIDYLPISPISIIQGLHSASVPGILALDINPSDHSKLLTGGNDRNATVFNKDTEQVVAILKGHSKKVTRVIYHPDEDTVITASPDHTIRVWNVPT